MPGEDEGMSKESGSSRTDTIVKVMLVFFISLLSFSVGTFVGKQVSDSDHRRMALENEFQGREVASNEGGASAEKAENGRVTDKEVENLAEEFVNKEKGEVEGAKGEEEGMKVADAKEGADGYKTYTHGKEGKEGKKEEKTEKAPAGKAEKKEMSKTEESVVEKVANNKAASDGEVEQRKPSSALPAVANSAVGKFTVQVGSYPSEDEASNQAKILKTKGWAAFYVPAAVAGKTWYRVMV